VDEIELKKKNHLKTYYQLKTKNISKLGSVFLSAFKVRKHIILTPIIIWNRLTHKWTILVARIITNRNFFSLRWNSATLSPLQKKKLKEEENENWYQNWIFLN